MRRRLAVLAVLPLHVVTVASFGPLGGPLLGCSSSTDEAPAPTDGAAETTIPEAGDDAKDGGDATPDATLDAPPLACSVVAQDCGAGKRCTLVNLTPAGRENKCLDDTGTKKLGDPCTRKSFGDDDCQKGGLCTTLPGPAIGTPTCKKLCAENADCGGAERCYNFGNGPRSLGGVCLPTCTLFGSDCPLATNCGLYYDPRGTTRSAFCSQPSGSALLDGMACQVTNDCGNPSSICLGAPPPYELNDSAKGVCTPLCDSSHTCTGGKTCGPLAPSPTGVGACK